MPTPSPHPPLTTDEQRLTYLVAGMTCDHCTVAVTEEVTKVAGVAAVEVDLDTKLVRIHGTGVDRAAVDRRDRRGRLRRGGGMSPADEALRSATTSRWSSRCSLGMAVLGLPAGWATGRDRHRLGAGSPTTPRRCSSAWRRR